MSGEDFWLSKILSNVDEKPGESGYFSSPSTSLDPRLFTGDLLRPEVRDWILTALYNYWTTKFSEPKQWSTVWLAGSGISYQWAAGRGNGDLDVLIGVDFPMFFRFNDNYLGFGESDVADIFNIGLHHDLWPITAQTSIHTTGSPVADDGTDVFEVTFYVNPGSTDIRDINPYAAYNITEDQWTVRPPNLSQNPTQAFPQAFTDAAEDERRYAHNLIDKYNHVALQVRGQQPDSPGWHNTIRQAEILTSQAKTLFDDIHLGRRNAFGPGGSGYGDYFNYRWQFHKKAGTVQALDTIAHARNQADEAYETALYGAPIAGAEVALRRAAMAARGIHG